MTKHTCLHEHTFQEIAEFKGSTVTELKNINSKLDQLIESVSEIRGKPPSLTKLWIILTVMVVSAGGGVGLAKIL